MKQNTAFSFPFCHFTIMRTFPRLGFGTWKCQNNEQVTEAVRYAIEEAGYRHIDCAFIYGNETFVGKALHDVLSRGVVKREELWITSKLWCTEHDPKDVEAACRNTLKDLQLDYLDLYLIHDPYAYKKIDNNPAPRDANGNVMFDRTIPISDTWKAMEKLVPLGLCKHIGVANFNIELLEKIRVAPGVTMKPYTNQVELHLYLQQPALIQYCQSRNIIVTGYSCLGTPDSASPDCPILLKDEVLNAVAKEINKTPAQTELRFLLELGSNVVVLAKSVTPERIRSNIDLDFELTQEQMERLKNRDRYFRYCDRLKMLGINCFGDEW